MNYLNSLWQLKRPRILSITALAHRVATLVVFLRDFVLNRHSQATVLDLELDVLLFRAWELESGCYEVFLFVFV